MQYNTATLNNGLRIIHLPNNSKIAYCGYQIKAGTRNEKPGDEGLAHFCEHVTFKGTQTHTSTAIINKLESVGGDLNAFTNKEDTVFYSAIPVEHFAKAVDVLSDIVFYSIFPQAEIDKEVEVICDEIESYNDSPAELIYDEFENLVFKGHPLGHNILGSADRVRGFATADAMRFTQQYYRPDNAIFFVYGNIDFKRLVKTLEKLTPKQLQESVVDEALVVANGKLPELTILNHDTHQAHVMIGNRAYSATHPLRIPLYLLNNILGGPGMNARLNVILRERRGLVYSVESSMVCYGDTGLWSVYFGCDPHDVNRCVRLVKGEFKRLMEKPLPEKTLAAAKKQIKGQLAVACDNNENFAIDFGKSFLHFGDEKDIEKLYQKIDAVTAEQIQQVAKEIFDKDSLATLVIK
ncbi:MAG: pitrilysin family protein [Prevotella sp.]|nr:pitrilysin family protein [Prevotella sp.]MDY4150916.1 pitrilysin family protein [Prevotella sp.]